jgi:hypothetical protein
MLVFLIVDVVCLQACSEYHYLLLYADKLVALNQISGKVAAEVNWGPGSHTPSISGKDTTRCAGLDTNCQLALLAEMLQARNSSHVKVAAGMQHKQQCLCMLPVPWGAPCMQ